MTAAGQSFYRNVKRFFRLDFSHNVQTLRQQIGWKSCTWVPYEMDHWPSALSPAGDSLLMVKYQTEEDDDQLPWRRWWPAPSLLTTCPCTWSSCQCCCHNKLYWCSCYKELLQPKMQLYKLSLHHPIHFMQLYSSIWRADSCTSTINLSLIMDIMLDK